jgi:hypothetical protein
VVVGLAETDLYVPTRMPMLSYAEANQAYEGEAITHRPGLGFTPCRVRAGS